MRRYRISFTAAASIAAALLLAGSSALGSTPAAVESWVVSGGSLGGGTVKSIAVSGSTAYLGGNFSYIGPPTGSAALFDTPSGAANSWPAITGIVYAIAPDGSNGWYVGGSFRSIGTAHYDNLVHILANGTVDPNWHAGTNGPVFSLLVAGSTLYAGGAFTQAHDADPATARANLAAFTAATGELTSLNLAVTDASDNTANAFVWTMATSTSGGNTNVYLGGKFNKVGGQTRNNLAAVTTGGSVAIWNPNVNNTVRALASDGDDLMYAGGEFTAVNGGFSARSRLAAFDEDSAVADSWNPGPTQSLAPFPPSVNSLAVSGIGALATIYVGGYFTSIGSPSAPRHAIAALTATGTVVAGFDPDIRSPQSVNRIVVSGTGPSATVYAGGFFQTLHPGPGSVSRDCIVALNASDGVATSFHPVVGGAVHGLAIAGSKIAVGGQFRSAGLGSMSDPFPSPLRRDNLGAIDLSTGKPTSWAPYADNTVEAIAISGSTVYAGGRFDVVKNAADTATLGRTCLAAFEASDGDVLPWDPGLDATPPNTPCVNTIAVSGSTVYVGGNFSLLFDSEHLEFVTRNGIAAFDDALTAPGFGHVKDWNPNAGGAVNTIVVSGSTVFAGGDFITMGGVPRNRLASIDTTSGIATDWNPNVNGAVQTLALSGSTIYAGGSFTQVNNGNVDRSGAAAFAASDVGEFGALSIATDWDPNVEKRNSAGSLEPGTVNSIATTSGSVVYLGGDFDSIGGGSGDDEGAAVAVTGSTGAALSSWQPEPNDIVDEIALAQAGILVGGSFTAVGYPRPFADFETPEPNAKARGGFAMFLGLPEPPGNVTAAAGNGSATVTFTPAPFNGGGAVTYTVTASPGGQQATGSGSPLQVIGLTNGQEYTFTVTATNSVGTSAPSAASNPVTPSVGPTTPGAPINVTAVAGNGEATVSFDPPASNGGSAITDYTVTASGGGPSLDGPSSPITITGLTNGQSYTFTVTATNGIGTGPPSAPSNAVTPRTVPGSPTGVSATPGNAQASVGFTPPASNGGSPITGYTVTASPGGLTGTGTSSPIVVDELTNGTSYTFTVTATNGAGTGPASSPSSAVTPHTIPGAPADAAAVPGNGQATVSFTSPINGGDPITSYTVTSSPGGHTASGAGSPIAVTGLTNGQSYTFTVTATNGAGIGPASSPSNAVVPGSTPTAPGAPTGVTATPGNAKAVVSFTPPASDGGTAITEYTVTATPGGQTAKGPSSPIAVEGLANGTSYTFTVTATNGAGTGPPSSPSNAVTPAVPGRPPAPPNPPATQPRPDVPDVPPQSNPRKPPPPH